jgi:hypothetical protein
MHASLIQALALIKAAMELPSMSAGMTGKVLPRQSLPSNLPLSSEQGNSGQFPV